MIIQFYCFTLPEDVSLFALERRIEKDHDSESFSLGTLIFTDGSKTTCFHAPTDMKEGEIHLYILSVLEDLT